MFVSSVLDTRSFCFRFVHTQLILMTSHAWATKRVREKLDDALGWIGSDGK